MLEYMLTDILIYDMIFVMIEYPNNWNKVGDCPSVDELDELITEVLSNISCTNLSLSGGVDSSLMLYYMVKLHGNKVKCFNLAGSPKHPDYIYSELVSRHFNVDCYHFIPDNRSMDGDEIVSTFYNNLSSFHHIKSIISCDGIDELSGGYYDHARLANEDIFFNYLSRLQEDQLKPLDKNSKDIKVFLPYLDVKLVSSISFIPLKDRYGKGYRKKFVYDLAKGKIPMEIIDRRKYGFCDALKIKN